MDKKLIGVLVIVIVVLLGIGAYTYMNMNKASFGKSTVTIPDGFSVKKSNNTNGTVLGNNNTTYYINENHNKSIDDVFKDYKSKYSNDTVVEKQTNIGNITVRTITLKHDDKVLNTNHYYQKDGIIYHVYVTGKNNQTAFNKIVSSTTKSMIPS